MADLLRLGQHLTRDTDGDGQRDVFGFSFFGKPQLLWLPFVWSDGADLYSPDFTQLRLTEPATAEAIQFTADLRNRWHVAPSRQEVGSATMSQLFLQGKLAMLLSGRWTVPVLRTHAPFDWDVAPFPRGKAGSVVGIDASGYAIARDTKHPKESWAVIQYLSQPEAQRVLAQSGLIVPARQDVARSPEFLAGDPAHSRYFIDAIVTGHPSHTPVRWNEVSEELGLALEPVWEGTQRADVALHRVASKLRKLLP
jgi:multiple sugar transport system substrate-binding protein